jgi:acyl carrier protein
MNDRDASSVLRNVLQFIGEYLGHASIAPDDDLWEAEILDSLRVVELLSFLEDRYAVQIPLTDVTFDSFQTPRRIAVIVEGKLSSRATS